jgi:hypothetical protein
LVDRVPASSTTCMTPKDRAEMDKLAFTGGSSTAC